MSKQPSSKWSPPWGISWIDKRFRCATAMNRKYRQHYWHYLNYSCWIQFTSTPTLYNRSKAACLKRSWKSFLPNKLEHHMIFMVLRRYAKAP
jgi:hypothetical protein